jgi:hypothetical protein
MDTFHYVMIICVILFIFFIFVPDSWLGINTEHFSNNDGIVSIEDDGATIPDGKGGVEKILKPDEASGHELVPGSMYQLADVEGLGRKCNWCRVVREVNKPNTSFVACSLYQTFTGFPYWFKSPSKRQGFDIGRHGYMKDVTGNGADSYCRLAINKDIIRPLGRAPVWEITCNLTEGLKISEKKILDPDPPEDKKKILDQYTGCILWLPLMTENLNDIIRDLQVVNSGGVEYDQRQGSYLWDGQKKSLTMFERISWQHTKAVCCWVRFKRAGEGDYIFPRWSKVFDFHATEFKSHFFLGNEDTTRNLIMEIWHGASRVMRVQVKDYFPEDEWVHVCLTVDDPLSLRPTWVVYRNGEEVHRHEDGRIPDDTPARVHKLGESGDTDDEYFKGNIRDLRFYETPLSQEKIKEVMEFYQPKKSATPGETPINREAIEV